MSWKFSNFVDLLSYRALEQSEKIVFTFLPDGETAAESLTYQQLDEQARAIAAKLQSLQATGERALLLYQPGLEFISAFFGCLYAGVTAVPAYPPRANRSVERLQAIVSDAEAKFALTTQGLLSTIEGRLTHAAKALSCITTDNINLHCDCVRDWQLIRPEEDSLAFLQYTSGSTGTPKGVMVSHGNLIHNSGLINRCFQDTPESKGVSWLPPYHDMGLIGGILQPIYVGASMTLMPPVTFLQRPFRWLQAISRDRVTTSGAPNFAYDLCVNQITPEQRETLDLSCWELAFTGAEPVRAETLESFAQSFSDCGFRKAAFYPCYGMAETTLIVTGGSKTAAPILKTFEGKALEQNQVVGTHLSENGSVTLVGCGQIVEGQLSIVNPETLQVCPAEEIGEIWVKNNSVARGYWNRQTQTEETFNAHIADTNEEPFLRTGDLGFVRDGELFVTGRLKDLVIVRGRNHYPQDIELTVEKSHDAIREACGAAFSVDVEGEERLVITYEVKRSAIRSLKAEEVARSIRQAVVQNHELQPFAIAFLKTGSIPKTSSGKIQRHACKAGFLKGSLDLVGEWKQGDKATRETRQPAKKSNPGINSQQSTIQVWLVENIARRLGISPQEIDVGEPFASYGLDSVQAVRLTAELEDWLGRKLSPTLAYDYPTIEDLAHYLGQGDGEIGQQRNDLPSPIQPAISSVEPVAIVGIGCRFPSANNPEAFWQLLREGKDAITSANGRWQGNDWGGFLDRVDLFDPQFFGISPREAREMDPQQRLLLEVSWEALENAGIAADGLTGSATGVFMGISSSDYSQIRLRDRIEPDAYAGTGNAHSIAANRLSYFLDLRGPSLTVDTACSSSLVALHLATRSLQNGECDRALAGGVNLILSPELTQTFDQAGMMAADGRCKTFDASADGYVRGEGCGVVILKRLSDAVRDRDNILALIRGSAINQDGRSNGLTAPNGLAQQAAIRQALANAGTNPAEIDYIEAHGTGTSLGDPIEVNSLKTVLMQGRSSKQPLWLGSVKTNIGHLEAAAGIAGLIKIVLCFQHQEIPPHLHLNTLNPHIDLKDTPIAIPTQLQPWTKGEKPRLAGVSSFGFGGTNAHLILEEFIHSKGKAFGASVENHPSHVIDPMLCPHTPIQNRTLHLLTLSAKNETALKDLVKSYENYLTSHPEVSLEDICFTANTGRSHFKHRLAIISHSLTQLQEQLAAFKTEPETSGIFQGSVDRRINPKIAFLFTGQGSQYVGMGYQLYQTQPTFRAALDRCAAILEPYLERPLLEILYPELGNESENSTSLLDETYYTQPALFALEYALAKLWQSWGIKPSIVMGHSVGEYVAACIAGVFSLEDGLKLIAQRAKLMQALPSGGKMFAVFADEATVQAAIAPSAEKVAIAAINGSQSIVISGEKDAIGRAIESLKDRGVKTRKLKVSHAFHSALMEPMLAEFERVASQIEYSAPSLDIIANLTGTLAGEEIATPQYWVDHIRKTVQFNSSIKLLDEQGYQIFLEIGTKPTLLGMGRSILEGSPNPKSLFWLPSLRPGMDDWQQILTSLATLFVQGIKIDWQGCDRDYPHQRIGNLPTYPFQRQRYWIQDSGVGTQSIAPAREFGGKQQIDRDWFYQVEWQRQDKPVVAGLANNLLNKPVQAGLASNFLHPIITDVQNPPLHQNPPRQIQNPNVQNHQNPPILIFADRAESSDRIIQQLVQSGQNCILIYPGDRYQEIPNATLPAWEINPAQPEDFQRLFQEGLENISSSFSSIIHLWSLDADPLISLASLEDAQRLGCRSLLYLLQALSTQAITAKIWLVTRGTQAIDSRSRDLSIAQSPLWGLGKVIALEHPEYWGGIVDLAQTPDEHEAILLTEEILNPEEEDRISFRNGQRYVERLKREVRQNPEEKIQLNGSYLVTGGLGELGLQVAQHLVNKGAKNLILMGRSEPSPKATEMLQALEQAGAKVLVAKADVANEQDVSRVLAEIQTAMPPLRGIIHAAGLLDDGLLAGLSWERFTKVLEPKIKGAWNLHQLTQEIPLDFFVMFSSVAALLGSPGQGNYAAANAFLDAIAYYRKAKGLPALSINWGPLSVGMAATKRLGTTGLDRIPIERGLEILTQCLSANTAQIGVFSADWETLSQQFPDVVRSPYFHEIVGEASDRKVDAAEDRQIFEQLLKMSSIEREEFLTSYLQSSLAQILQLSGQSISPADSLLDLGMDSLMVMEAVNKLKSDLQLMLYPREFYERPKIEVLAKYLATEFEKSYGNGNARESALIESLPAIQDRPLTLDRRNNVRPQLTLDKKLPEVAFILSSPRSGSTLLRVMLAGHPDLASPPELHLLPFDMMAHREEELALSHLGEGLQRAFMELKGIDAPTAESLVAELVQQNRSVPEVYALLQELAGQRLLVDKSPTYAFHRETLERAEAMFDGAKYIHLVRHPYSVIESFCRLRMDKLVGAGDENPYQLAESIWTNSNQNILDFFQQIDPERHHLVLYEDLVKEPSRVMQELCEFLGIPFNASVLTPYEGKRMTDGVRDRSMSVGDPNFLSRDRIDPQLAEAWKTIQLPHQLGKSSRRVAIALNYQLPQEERSAEENGDESENTPDLMQEEFLNVRGLNLCVCSWGERDRSLALCLHGILEQGAAWREVAVRLVKQGYRVVAPDLRGHGRSDRVGRGGSYNLLDFLADIDAIVEQLSDRPFTLVGHSLGSVLAAMFASIRPQKVKNLVLVETVLPTEVNEGEAVEQLATHLNYLVSPPEHPIFSDVAAAAERLRLATPALSESFALQLAERITEPYQNGVRWRWDALLRTRAGIGFNGIDKSRYLGLLRKIRAPITLIYGDRSDFNRPEDLAEQQKAMSQATRIVLSGGHNLHLEVPSELARIIAGI